MVVKQINTADALRLALEGQEIMVLAPGVQEPNAWTDYIPDTLSNMLENCMFFREEPEDEECVKENNQGETEVKEEKKKRTIDAGKIWALHKAGWNNKKIAEEMRVSAVTIGKYLKKQEEKGGSEDV